jgi:MoxR-like ATPase
MTSLPPFLTWSELNAGDESRQEEWRSIRAIDALLGGITDSVPDSLALPCWERLRAVRNELVASWRGCDETIDWLLSTFLARENALLIGPPGGAKSEMVTRLFSVLGLSTPTVDMDLIGKSLLEQEDLLQWWEERRKFERQTPKQFHFLLQRFVQPEELFGPIEIDLLRRGVLVRVNFGMLTGPGVFAAFLDEIFTASPNLLNTLLTLLNERKYSNWGGMVQGDLLMLAAASNALPGGDGLRDEEFRASYALLDRFAVRLRVDIASASNVPGSQRMDSDLAQATGLALARESNRFTLGTPFAKPAGRMASLSDLLCLGRYLYQHMANQEHRYSVYDHGALDAYERNFYLLAASLQRQATRLSDSHAAWTISPRKLKALYKVGLAHSLIRSANFDASNRLIYPTSESLLAFTLIWDSIQEQETLAKSVRAELELGR